jgi:AAA15 family ATPase/GTPase
MLQLCAIAIYSHRGERRVVRFDLGKLNIVTGSSKSGKSSLSTSSIIVGGVMSARSPKAPCENRSHGSVLG